MVWGVPVDVAIFGLVVIAFFVVGLPLITSRVSVPTRVESTKTEGAAASLNPLWTTYEFPRTPPDEGGYGR